MTPIPPRNWHCAASRLACSLALLLCSARLYDELPLVPFTVPPLFPPPLFSPLSPPVTSDQRGAFPPWRRTLVPRHRRTAQGARRRSHEGTCHTPGALRSCQVARCSSPSDRAAFASSATACSIPSQSPASRSPRRSGSGGLMDVVLHPRFAENRLVYLTYTPSPARTRT